MTTIDTTGLSCPQPVLMVKNMLGSTTETTIKVLVDAEASRENVTRFVHSAGWQKTAETLHNGIWTMVFTRNAKG